MIRLNNLNHISVLTDDDNYNFTLNKLECDLKGALIKDGDGFIECTIYVSPKDMENYIKTMYRKDETTVTALNNFSEIGTYDDLIQNIISVINKQRSIYSPKRMRECISNVDCFACKYEKLDNCGNVIKALDIFNSLTDNDKDFVIAEVMTKLLEEYHERTN